jgi:hypothetical protein
MIMIVAFGFLLGAILAQFLTAFAVGPVTAIAIAATVIGESAGSHSLLQTAIACLCVASTVQCGFLLGAFFRSIGAPIEPRSFKTISGSIGPSIRR